ncbi:MAG TPA: hypothetical protein VHV50_14445, partial [Actinomycetota bacterium]|nr:hypothetical protein [Actinomycetota bacterium]
MTDHKLDRSLAIALVVAQASAVLVLSAGSVSAAASAPGEWVIGPRAHDVLITFDGRTSARHLASVLRTLTQKKTRASFFIAGAWVASHKKM